MTLTRTFARFLEREAHRVTGYSIEPDGVFIYTESARWADDAGSGTFRGDSQSAAMRKFRARVRQVTPATLCPCCQRPSAPTPWLPLHAAMPSLTGNFFTRLFACCGVSEQRTKRPGETWVPGPVEVSV